MKLKKGLEPNVKNTQKSLPNKHEGNLKQNGRKSTWKPPAKDKETTQYKTTQSGLYLPTLNSSYKAKTH
jgi:hypothetical protein